MDTTRTPLRRVAAPLREQAVEWLRDEIASGRYRPGERLLERPLCAELGVSRTVIREALRHLEAERLVEIRPNVGPVIPSLSTGEARKLYEVRASLESLAGRLCAQRADASGKRRLRDALDGVESAVDGPLDALIRAKDAFYDALTAGADNEIIDDVLRPVYARIRQLRALTLQSPGRAPHTLRELRAITDAVDAGDSRKASAACRKHVEAAAAIAIRALSAAP